MTLLRFGRMRRADLPSSAQRPTETRRVPAAISVIALLAASGCGDDTSHSVGRSTLSRAELLDPQTCASCHPNHYREWASSMHAYAADDPVFLAMNARGQREADLGDFCIDCHAPLAVREGYATDGKRIDEIPKHLRGVTCYYCHNVDAVDGTHNNPLQLANDTTMRGGLRDAQRPNAHDVKYSVLHDGTQLESSTLCGSCHDIVTPSGVHLERTFEEWKSSLFSHGAGATSCGGCHMDGYQDKAARVQGNGLAERTVHRHLFPGVDLALTAFPDTEVQRNAVQCALGSAVRVSLCPNPDASFEVRLETNAGHRFPSGASQDRRVWVELVAYDDRGKVLYESGVVPEGEVVDKPAGSLGYDADLWVLRDRIFDADERETHMFWLAAKSAAYPEGQERQTLPETKALGMSHSLSRTYRLTQQPARVRVQVHVQPIGREVLDDLVASGDLDAAIAAKMPTLTLHGTVTEWRQSDGFGDCITEAEPNPLVCPDAYECALTPDLARCQEN